MMWDKSIRDQNWDILDRIYRDWTLHAINGDGWRYSLSCLTFCRGGIQGS